MSKHWKIVKHGKDEAPIKRKGCFGVDLRPGYVAIIDGVATLFDICPEPRARTIRAFKHHPTQWESVESALAHDWVVVGQDMSSAIKVHEHKANEEAALTTTERPSTR